MKKIILMATVLLSFSSFAQNNPNTNSKPPTEADKAKIAASFPQRKAIALQVIADREKILYQEKECVSKTNTTEELRSCFVQANQTRKQMGNDLKAKFPPKKENKEMKK